MSSRALKRLVLLLGFTALIVFAWHALRPPIDAVAKPKAAPALTFQGGSGDTPATAVVIGQAPDYVSVVAGEYQYLGKLFGKRDRDWQVAQKEVYQHGEKVYDLFTIESPNGAKQMVFFDITKYFKKP